MRRGRPLENRCARDSAGTEEGGGAAEGILAVEVDVVQAKINNVIVE